jgi:hypothetical protein
MKLRLNDAMSTVLAAGAVLVTMAVTQGWSWPLLSSYRAGAIALGLIGIAMCATGSSTAQLRFGGYAILAGGLGILALVLVVYGLIAATETALLSLTAVLLALWLITTIRHMTQPADIKPFAGVTG